MQLFQNGIVHRLKKTKNKKYIYKYTKQQLRLSDSSKNKAFNAQMSVALLIT